jgi:hypothetical protein
MNPEIPFWDPYTLRYDKPFIMYLSADLSLPKKNRQGKQMMNDVQTKRMISESVPSRWQQLLRPLRNTPLEAILTNVIRRHKNMIDANATPLLKNTHGTE